MRRVSVPFFRFFFICIIIVIRYNDIIVYLIVFDSFYFLFVD